jgi:hypothetical protein
MLSTVHSSRRGQTTQKPIIHTRESSANSRSTYSTQASTYHGSSGYSDASRNYTTSSRSSERSFQEPREHTFRAPDSSRSSTKCTTRDRLANVETANYRGNYIYSSDRVKVINHNARAVETDQRLRSSHATHEDYKRTQQRYDRNKQHHL